MPEETVLSPPEAATSVAPAVAEAQPTAPPEPVAVTADGVGGQIGYGNVIKDNTLSDGRRPKREGVLDSEAARAAKKLANQRIGQAAAPAVDFARTRMSPKLHAVTDVMRTAGWKKFGIGVGLVGLALLLLSLLGVGR